MTRRGGNRIVCEICGRPCRSAAGLADHEQAKHRPAIRHLEAARLAAAQPLGARA